MKQIQDLEFTLVFLDRLRTFVNVCNTFFFIVYSKYFYLLNQFRKLSSVNIYVFADEATQFVFIKFFRLF